MLTEADIAALRAVRTGEGRHWKLGLRIMWERAHYPGYERHAAVLQNLRNCSYFGPSGLDKLKSGIFYESSK